MPAGCRSFGQSETCPDNRPWDTSNFTDHSNLLGMLDDLRFASARFKATGQPFFLNYGLHRPHLPFHAPASFPDPTGKLVNHWDKYGPDDGIALPQHRAAPKDMPGIAFTYEMDGQVREPRRDGTPPPAPRRQTPRPLRPT